MLLLDDDEELPLEPDQDEASLAARLGSNGLRAIDTVLIGYATRRWLKVARIVADALQAGGLPISDDTVDLHVRRVIVLASQPVWFRLSTWKFAASALERGSLGGGWMSSSTEGQDFSRHRIEAVYQDGSRVLFTHVDLMREQVTAGAFSRELATLIGEDILIRLGAASRQPR